VEGVPPHRGCGETTRAGSGLRSQACKQRWSDKENLSGAIGYDLVESAYDKACTETSSQPCRGQLQAQLHSRTNKLMQLKGADQGLCFDKGSSVLLVACFRHRSIDVFLACAVAAAELFLYRTATLHQASWENDCGSGCGYGDIEVFS
jgi:hypothetical protein